MDRKNVTIFTVSLFHCLSNFMTDYGKDNSDWGSTIRLMLDPNHFERKNVIWMVLKRLELFSNMLGISKSYRVLKMAQGGVWFKDNDKNDAIAITTCNVPCHMLYDESLPT